MRKDRHGHSRLSLKRAGKLDLVIQALASFIPVYTVFFFQWSEWVCSFVSYITGRVKAEDVRD